MKFNNFDMRNKRILLRADLNVPLNNGTIFNDFRLKALLPTIQNILTRGGAITLLTHLGRPTEVNPRYSTSHLLPWFRSHKIPIAFARSYEEARHHSATKNNVVLFENLRFFPGEQSHDPHKRKLFCEQLAPLGELFVTEAFGALHRNDASIVLLPLLFPETCRALGPLVTSELANINTLKSPKNSPLICIIGGKKVATKLASCDALSSVAQVIIIGPALSFTCMKAQGISVGSSLVDTSQIPHAKKILEKKGNGQAHIYLPEDYLVTNESFPGHTLYKVDAHTIPAHATGVTIGPKSIHTIQHLLRTAGSIFYTGLIGSVETPDALSGSYHLFNAMAHARVPTMIAGGDSVAAAQLLTLDTHITYLSTGGSSALIYLAYGRLPGLAPFTTY